MIFNYSHYLDFLRDYIAEQQKDNLQSLRKIATDYSQDHGTLSRVLRGERKLSIPNAESFANKMNLTAVEYEYFMLMVEVEHITTSKAKSIIQGEIDSLQRQRTLPLAQTKSINIKPDFITMSIIALTQMDRVMLSPLSISQTLNVCSKDVEVRLIELQKNGVITKDPKRGFVKATDNTNFKTCAPDNEIESYLKSILDLSKEELDIGLAQNRIFRTRIAAIPKSKRGLVCQLIDTFLGRLYQETQSSVDPGDKDDLVCLNLNFFSLIRNSAFIDQSINPSKSRPKN